MSTDSADRRQFLLQAGTGLATAWMAGGPRARAGVGIGANQKIGMGFIGMGGMGTGRLREFMEHEDVEVVGLCDVDRNHLQAALQEVEKKRGKKPLLFHDFRKLLERKDLDAVMIATPDHWHTLPAIAAFQAGKDVFVEKPLSYSIGEGNAIVRAAAAHGRVSQVGIHIHNTGSNYRRAVEIVRSGMLGKISRVTCWKTSSLQGLGNPPDSAPPAELDYNFWLGPAPKRPYNPNRSHRSYRYFWDYSGGVFIDFWSHITDVAYWAMEWNAPRSVAANGGRFFLTDNTETPDTLDLCYEFPNTNLIWTLNPTPLPGFEHLGGIGCLFQGTDATLAVNYSQHELYSKGKKVPEFQRPPQLFEESPGHIREFLDAVKSRKPTTCNVEYAHRLNKGGLLGNIAFRTGRHIRWDEQKGRIANDRQADHMVTRRYRKPWKLS